MIDKRLWSEGKKHRLWLGLSVLLGVLNGGMVILLAWILSRVINGVFLLGLGLQEVTLDLLNLVEVIVLRALLTWGSEMCASMAAIGVKQDLRFRLYSHLYALGPAAMSREQTGELAAVGTEGIEALDAYFGKYLPQVVFAAVIPISMLVFIFPVDWISGIVLLVTAPLIPFFMVLIGKMAEQQTSKQWKTLSRLSAHFLDVMQGLVTLKSLGSSREMARSIDENNEAYTQATLQVLRITFLSALTLELLATLSTAIVAVEIGLRLLHDGMLFRQALFILVLAPEYYLPLRTLGLHFHAGMDGVAAADRICHLLSIEPERRQKTTQKVRFSSRIEFNHVTFVYPERQVSAVKDVNLVIEHGVTTALVGTSGAGKSTLVNLLLGFLSPQQGEIMIDGVNLKEIDLDSWRENISWVSQQSFIFQGTIEQNLRFVKPEASWEQIERAIQQAQFYDFIRSLPQGYQTQVGEGGTRLSGGQAQRLVLARAFLRDAPLLVLDEPSAHLDPQTEASLQSTMHELMVGRTALVIAHRLNTVVQADKIIVLNEGKVVETGNHQSLMKASGIYTSLVQAHTGVVR